MLSNPYVVRTDGFLGFLTNNDLELQKIAVGKLKTDCDYSSLIQQLQNKFLRMCDAKDKQKRQKIIEQIETIQTQLRLFQIKTYKTYNDFSKARNILEDNICALEDIGLAEPPTGTKKTSATTAKNESAPKKAPPPPPSSESEEAKKERLELEKLEEEVEKNKQENEIEKQRQEEATQKVKATDKLNQQAIKRRQDQALLEEKTKKNSQERMRRAISESLQISRDAALLASKARELAASEAKENNEHNTALQEIAKKHAAQMQELENANKADTLTMNRPSGMPAPPAKAATQTMNRPEVAPVPPAEAATQLVSSPASMPAPGEVQTHLNPSPYIIVRPPPVSGDLQSEPKHTTVPVSRPAPSAPPAPPAQPAQPSQPQITGPFGGGSVTSTQDQHTNPFLVSTVPIDKEPQSSTNNELINKGLQEVLAARAAKNATKQEKAQAEQNPKPDASPPPHASPAQGGAPRPPPPPTPAGAAPQGKRHAMLEAIQNPKTLKPVQENTNLPPKEERELNPNEVAILANYTVIQSRRGGKTIEDRLAETKAARLAEDVVKPPPYITGIGLAKIREELRRKPDQIDPTNTEAGGARELAKSGITLSEEQKNQHKTIAEQVQHKRKAHGSETGSESSVDSDWE